MSEASGKIESSESTAIALRPEQGFRVVAATHPFKVAERIDRVMLEGLTLAEILEIAQPDEVLRMHAHITIGDMRIPKENWRLVRPKGGVTVTIRVVPHGGGGGGKNPLRTVLTIAVIAASLYFGGPLAASLGVPSAGTTILGFNVAASQIGGAIISIAGNLLINALAPVRPPKMQAQSGGLQSAESPTLFISGARNQANVFGPVPVVLGKHAMKPPYGALPYTEIVGNDQYVRMVFVWGKGPLLIENLVIGTTPIENFSGVQVVNRAGYPGDPGLSLYTNDVFEESFSILVTNAGGYVVRNTQLEADEIAVDVLFGRGLTVFNDQGERTPRTVEFDVEYAPVGSTAWVGGGLSVGGQTSAAMAAESTVINVLRPGIASAASAAKFIAEGADPAIFYYTETAVTPHRYDLVVLDRWSGVVSVITGNRVLGSTAAEIPSYSTAQVPLAAIYRDTSATVVSGNITDMRPASTGWTTDFAVTANGTNTVSIAAGTLASSRQSVTGQTSEALRSTIRFKVPTRGQYQVRLLRVTADSTDSETFDELSWTILRTITYRPPFEANGLATTELLIKATDQLQQVIDQLGGTVTSILPDYDYLTETWIVRPTQNPASHVRAVLQGPGNARGLADSRIDLPSLVTFHNYCRTQGFKFNMVRDFVASVFDTMLDVCASAFSSPAQVDGKWGVITDNDKIIPIQHFTPRNSSNFSFDHSYPERPHGWRMRFVNEREGYEQDERIVYDDGYDETNATKFESLESPGTTDPDLVWRIGRRRIAEGRLRPEKYTFTTDIENIVCTRGDLVLITHDVISTGLASGRIKTVTVDGGGNCTAIEIDNPVDMQAGNTYGVVIRTIGGSIHRAVTNTGALNVATLTLTTPIPPDAEEFPVVQDIFGFGVYGQETLEALVTKITRADDIAATLVCVPLARAIFSADTGTIPEFNPNVSTDVGTIVPFIVSIRSDESVLYMQSNGVLKPSIRLTFSRFSSSIINRADGIEAQYKAANEEVFRSAFVVKQDILEIDLNDVEQGVEYQIKVRYTYADRTAEFSPTYTHVVIGMSNPPDDVTGLVLEGDYLRWTYTRPRDFAGFLVRTSNDTTVPWENMYQAHDGLLSDTQFDITNFQRGTRIFAVKAIDQAGNESVNTSFIIRDFGTFNVANILETIDYDADGFPGTITGASVSGGVLEADSTTLYLTNDDDAYLTVDGDPYLPDQFLELDYVTTELIIDENYIPGRMTIDLTSSNGVRVLYRVGEDADYLPVGGDPYLPVGGDPYLPPTWLISYRDFPGYIDLQLGEAYQFKLLGPAGQSGSTVSNFDVVIDVDDEEETFSGVVLSAGGTRLPLTKTYRSVVVVNGNLRSGSTAVKIETLDFDATLGPLVRAFDNSGTGVAATIDGIIRGVKG